MDNKITVEEASANDVIDGITKMLDDLFNIKETRVQDYGDYKRIRFPDSRQAIRVDWGRSGVTVDISETRGDVESEVYSLLSEFRIDNRDSSRHVKEEGPNGEVHKPFDHQEANYKRPVEHDSDPCKTCAHYDDHGNCRIVEDIDPMGNCEEFYADVGIYGRDKNGGVAANMIIYGDNYDWSEKFVSQFMENVYERLRN